MSTRLLLPAALFLASLSSSVRQSGAQLNLTATERGILSLLYASTGGEDGLWEVDDGWLSDDRDICSWHGVSCNAGGGVVALSLESNGLAGTSPPELFGLSSLERLALDGNEQLSVLLEGIGLARSLRYLSLSDTGTASTEGLNDASETLTALNVSGTLLTANSVREIFEVKSLTVLDFGSLSSGVGNILDDLYRLSKLQYLACPDSGITGTIPSIIGELSDLTFVDVSNNRIEGTIPSEISGLSKLTHIDFHGNALSGDLPLDFLSGVFDPTGLIDVNLGHNFLRGSIPPSLGRFDELNIDLTGNQITEVYSSLCTKTGWMMGNVGRYGCDAILCPPGTYNRWGRQVSEEEPCTACPSSAFYFGSTSCGDDSENAMEPTSYPQDPPMPSHDPAGPPFEETDESAENGGGDYSPLSSSVQVHEPEYLFKSGGYDHRVALFGTPLYGASIQEYLYYADSDLCDPVVDTRKGYPLRPIGETGAMMPWPAPFILLVDRGGCTFVRKVRHAQLAGAAAVIIADNTCLCSAGDECESNSGFDCETQEPIMADDGSGEDIVIPSVLMFKQDADVIKAELMANIMVLVEMSWRQSPVTDYVKYEIWTTPKDLVSRDLMRSFGGVAEALGSRAYFTPHMYIYDGIKSGCIAPDGSNLCYNLCTNGGRYCATDPDNDLFSGADVVAESLRRLCVWRLYGADDGVGIRWWQYLDRFVELCENQGRFADASCINSVFDAVGIDSAAVESCMIDSGGLEGDNSNSVLEEEIQLQEQNGIVTIPSIRVNGLALRGAASSDNLFTSICSAYAEDWTPDVCVECAGCPDMLACTSEGICEEQYSDDVHTTPDGDCTLECYNGGVCRSDRCICPNGFGGYQCETMFEVCNDGHRCENGGECVQIQHPDDTDTFFCDCSNASIDGLPSVGLYCENVATVICGQEDNGTINSFCTNGGVCVQVQADESHGGCICPPTFQGTHCEYLVGSEGTPDYENSDGSEEVVCPDEERVCVNGGECRAWPDDSGAYYCNCDAALSGGFPHSGESCEVAATSLCNSGPPYTSFCANGGECITAVPPGETHVGCRCRDEHEGAFCQITRGVSSATQSLRTALSNNSSNISSADSWKLALAIVLPVCAVIGLVAAFLAMHRMETKEVHRDDNEGQERDHDAVLSVEDVPQEEQDRGLNEPLDEVSTSDEELGAGGRIERDVMDDKDSNTASPHDSTSPASTKEFRKHVEGEEAKEEMASLSGEAGREHAKSLSSVEANDGPVEVCLDDDGRP